MRPYLAVLLIFIAYGTGESQSNDGENIKDGRFWRGVTNSEKLAYLVGYNEGLGRGLSDYAPDVKQLGIELRKEWPDLTFGEIREALDHFYETPENRPFAVVIAIKTVAMKTSGMTQIQIDTFLATVRQQLKNSN